MFCPGIFYNPPPAAAAFALPILVMIVSCDDVASYGSNVVLNYRAWLGRCEVYELPTYESIAICKTLTRLERNYTGICITLNH